VDYSVYFGCLQTSVTSCLLTVEYCQRDCIAAYDAYALMLFLIS